MNINLSEKGSQEMSRLLPLFSKADAAVDRALESGDRAALAAASTEKRQLAMRIANLVAATVAVDQWVGGVTQ